MIQGSPFLATLLPALLVLAFLAPEAHAQQVPEPSGIWTSAESPPPWAAAPFAAPTPVLEEPGDGISPEERAIAGGASWLLPGAGQFYKGERAKGAVMLGGAAASLVYAFAAGLGDREICSTLGHQQSCTTVPYHPNHRFWIGLTSAAAIQAWSIIDALVARDG